MPNAQPPKPHHWPLVGALAWFGTVGSLGVWLIAHVWHDRLEPASGAMLLGHYIAFMCQTFVYHAGLAMVPIVAFAVWSRRRRLLAAASVALALGVVPMLPNLWPRYAEASSRPSLKIMSVNLLYGMIDTESLLAQLRRESPDVVVFQEWTPAAGDALRSKLTPTFPHSHEQTRNGAFGQAVFSLQPFAEAPRAFPPVRGFVDPQITFAVGLGDKAVRITNIHLLSPGNAERFGEQRAQALRLGEWLADPKRDDRSDMLIGDFNSTLGSCITRPMREAGLADAHEQAGWWRGSTWPRITVLAWFPGIQLDHVFLRPTMECIEARTGEDFGSDHRPVIARVRWR